MHFFIVFIYFITIGTFVVFTNVSRHLNETGMSEEELVEYLTSNALVVLVPGSHKYFGSSAAGHIRQLVATSEEVSSEAPSAQNRTGVEYAYLEERNLQRNNCWRKKEGRGMGLNG